MSPVESASAQSELHIGGQSTYHRPVDADSFRRQRAMQREQLADDLEALRAEAMAGEMATSDLRARLIGILDHYLGADYLSTEAEARQQFDELMLAYEELGDAVARKKMLEDLGKGFGLSQ